MPARGERTTKPAVALKHSWQFWKALKEDAGLSLKGSAYDTAMVDELRYLLTGETKGQLGPLLKKHRVPIERLLSEFLRTAAPFAQMMTDVLAMFEAAAAKRSDRNLKLSVQLDEVDAPIEFDLASFTEQVERLTKAVAHGRPARLNPDNLWTIWHAFDHAPLVNGTARNGDRTKGPLPASHDLRAFIGRMDADHDFPALPLGPSSGHSWLDELSNDLWREFRAFHHNAKRRFETYSGLRAQLYATTFTEDEAPEACLYQAATDFWPSQIVQATGVIAERLKANPTDEEALAFVTEIQPHFPALPAGPDETESLQTQVQDVLNLPIWQKRHELFSVWIASQITQAMEPFGVTFHPDGDKLSFPFRKTHVATFGTKPGHRLELWSELRRPAVDPVGRKGKIQPDYMLLEEGCDGEANGRSILVVECKQYKRSSTGNFSRALGDYAKANSSAHVVLLNYGPFGDRVMDRVPEHVRHQCTGWGQVRPGEASLSSFKMAVKGIGQIFLARHSTPEWKMQQVNVKLSWEAAADLDLHLRSDSGSCGYNSPNGLAGATFSGDDLGVAPGLHVEAIRLEPGSDDALDIVVTAFARLASASEDPTAKLEIRWLSDGEPRKETIALDTAAARDWHVATIRKEDSEPRIVNRPAITTLRTAA